MSTRKPLIAANWKMYKTPSQSSEFVTAFLPLVQHHTRDEIVLCPPFVDIAAVVAGTRGSHIHVGGQNMIWQEEGAFTGEISAPMLLACGSQTQIDPHRLRWRVAGRTRKRQNGRSLVAANFERSRWGRAGSGPIHRHRLRTCMGHWYRQNSHTGDGRGSPSHHSRAGGTLAQP